MNRIITSALAFLAVASLPLFAVAPASATTSFDELTIDCNTNLSLDWVFNFPLYGYPLNVTLVNCQNDNIWDEGVTSNASIGGTYAAWTDPLDVVTNPATMVISGPVTVEFRDADDYLLGTASFDNPIDIPDPDGTLLSTDDHVIPVISGEFTIGTEQDFDDGTEMQIADLCSLVAGPHVYKSETLTVSESDDYTIRVVGQSPTGTGFHPNDPYSPWDDTVAIVYSSFNPAHPEDNIVGCGDELHGESFDPALASYGWYRTADGVPISISWPNFDLSLDAGTYTVVFTSWDFLSSDLWANGGDGGYTWDIGSQTITTELWGPAHGATFGTAELASTGVDPTFGIWAGLGLLGTGAVIAIARRRATRA